MASTSAAGKGEWHEGDRCLAPNPRDGIPREATIQRLSSTSHSNDTAWVIFTKDVEEEEQEEEAIPVLKLTRPGLNHFSREKPMFPGSIIDSSLCIPLELNGEDSVPYTINRYLRDYQREGIKFIYNNYISSYGCILGDDMGLGKTVQVIGFLAAVLHKTGTWEDIENNRPQFLQSQLPSKQSNPCKVFLIVAPLSVLYNWKDEMDTWGYFQCVVVHGLKKEEELARIRKGRTEIALTTYETLRLCLDQFNRIEWSAVVVDEAHKIKNPNSQITQAMKELRCKVRIGLTGTILQNNLEELWCVMDWAIPGSLGSLGHFKNKFSDPIERGQRHSTTKRALATGRKAVGALARKISPWFFRRTKALIKEQLPKKDDRVVYCSLTDFQHTVYQAVLDTEDVTLLLRSSAKCDCQSGRTRRGCCYKMNSEGVQVKELYFSYLAILRKVANHAALLQSTPSTSKKQEKYVSSVCAKVFEKFPDFVHRCKNEAFEALSDPMYSGKMKKLLKYYLQKRDKVLIFSLSTKLLDVLESYCMAEGLDFSRLDGSTRPRERVQIVKDFNSSSHVNLCLVSTMAGGLGLNFVGANVVVLFDPTWNPASDLQAIDRAYRIGQCRDVTVLRLISLGTVEEVIYLRQVYKQQLQCSVVGKESSRRYFEAVQGHGVHKGELFGIENLFRLQTQGTCLTRRILEREGQVEAGVMTTRTHRGDEKEETDKDGEPGDSLTDGQVAKDEAAKKTRDAAKIPKGVLDFSSGSEMDEEAQGLKEKASEPSADDDLRSGKANVGPGRTSLLQQGFSRLLERVKERPELGEGGSSSDVEGSPFEEDAEDLQSNGISKISSEGNGALCVPKSGSKTWDTSLNRKHEGNGDKTTLLKESDYAARRQGQKRWMDRQISGDDQSDENASLVKKKADELNTRLPKGLRFEGCSDESEDLDLEAKTCSKKEHLHAYNRGGDGGRGSDRYKRRQRASARDKGRSKYTEDIETFTSSEDERTSPATAGRRAGVPRGISFTSLKNQTSPASKEKNGAIDSVLGGVQEVVYTHSNQCVVGGSKAEELISRAAVRDVFERKMYSQLPANLLSTQESLPATLPDSQPRPATIQMQRPNVDHPVVFIGKSVHHKAQTTVIIGETPKSICRQQLEEMAEKFQFSSVHRFAIEILKRDSTQRLAWLRQYYTSLNHPDLADTVTDNFILPVSAQTSTSSTAASSPSKRNCHTENENRQRDPSRTRKRAKCTRKSPEAKTKHETPRNDVSVPQITSGISQNDIIEPLEKQKISQKNVLDPLCDVPGPESEEQEETVFSARGHKRTKSGSVSSSGAYRAGGGLGVNPASSSGLGSGEAAAFLNRTDRDTPSSSDFSHCSAAMLSKPTAQGQERELKSSARARETLHEQRENSQPAATSRNHSFLTDLIGDTSILDDLLKPKPKSGQQRSPTNAAPAPSVSLNTSFVDPRDTGSSLLTQPTQQVSAPVQASKGPRKDIWDILNEGNEESINRLTDPEEVQRICIDTNLAARNVSGQRESKSLWKTNEKFLWK
ncbi:DNA excision repair protein ERCC-6-like 2 isoform 2-T2 [Odontesthes bonariensis]|uniref:DNA excision repair protein ERCC-6-like 2 isoform X2 n=1 Tax=Odontesthes bonariensis TaxID=219752 RepID=UPI003F58F2B6